MSKTILCFISTLTISILLMTSCKKENGCYDEKLYQKYKNDICTMDCPGVTGCDGNTYCNECIARTKGIRLE